MDYNRQTSLLRWTALHYASFGGHIRVMKLLLHRPGDGSIVNCDGQTPLHVALSSGCQRAAAYLVKHGSDVSTPDRDGSTPLHMCVTAEMLTTTGWTENKRAQMVEFLLTKGALTCARNAKSESVLHVAARNDVGEETIALLAAKAREERSIGVKNNDGMTALHVANVQKVARALIGAGAMVDTAANDGSTALHLHTDNPQLVSLLLENGASRMLGDNRGRIPLHVALDRTDPIEDVVVLLSATGSEVNAQDGHKMTPLHILCSHPELTGSATNIISKSEPHGKCAIIERLIRQGANVDLCNLAGRTPLHLCIASRQYTIASILLAHGANPHSVDRYGLTPYRMDTTWFRQRGHAERVSSIRPVSPPPTPSVTSGKRVTFSKETKKGASSPDSTAPSVQTTAILSEQIKHRRRPPQRSQKNRLTPHGNKPSRRSNPPRPIAKRKPADQKPRATTTQRPRERSSADVTSTSSPHWHLPVTSFLPNWNMADVTRVMHTTAARRRVRRPRKTVTESLLSNEGRLPDDIDGIIREMNLILTNS